MAPNLAHKLSDIAEINLIAKVFLIFFFSTFTDVDEMLYLRFMFPPALEASNKSSSTATSSG